MADAVVLSIGDMIDLAIGTPEVGTVDFNMLQTVLHCLAQQQQVLEKTVEIRGYSVPQHRDVSNVQTVNVKEFAVGADGTPPVQKPQSPAPDGTILVVERVKKSESPSRAKTMVTRLTTGTKASNDTEDGSGGLSLVTYSKFNLLEGAVQELQKRVYGSIPNNEEILEEVRSQTNMKAIQDMWQNLNVSARLDAAEKGIEKLSSLVQDIVNETAGLQGKIDSVSTVAPTKDSPDGAPSTKQEIQDAINKLREDVENLTKMFLDAMKKMGIDPKDGTQIEEIMAPKPQVESGKGPTGESELIKLMERMNEFEKRLEDCQKDLGKCRGGVEDQLNSFQDQLEYMSKQLGTLSSVASGSLSPDLIKDLQGLMELFQTVQNMQTQLQQVHETALQLAAEKEDRKYHINVLLEQIELLKTIKLDREDMADAMAEKADLRMLARKVSHSQFETACDDLMRGLEQALGKLDMQEALWQQALDDIQREIETKMDKMELSPMKEFFGNKLKMLQDNLKQMASLRREAEAAGTKRKLLKDVKCISCDANAVMQTEAPPSVPVPRPFPATMSMKPYLSYELDTIRKTQASSLPQRNLHDWENIEKVAQLPKPQKSKIPADKHLCNRYCGGSHTTTTPAQRVARLGHFIKQWGPEVLPLSSAVAPGDDGRMYRVSAPDGAKVNPKGAGETTCTPRPQKTIELPPEGSEKLVGDICKCLEPDIVQKGPGK